MRDKRFIAEHRGGALSKEKHLELMKWACNCTEHVIQSIDEKIDIRIINAIEIGRKWADGKVSVGDARNASTAAIAAANEETNEIIIAIARSAGHCVATAHMADHSLQSAIYALKAIKLRGDSVEEERKWQNLQLMEEIKELVLTARKRIEKN